MRVRVHGDPLDPVAVDHEVEVPDGLRVFEAMGAAGVSYVAGEPMPMIGDEPVGYEHRPPPGTVLDVYMAPGLAGFFAAFLSKLISTIITGLAGLLVQLLFGEEEDPPKDIKPSKVYEVRGVRNEAQVDRPIPVVYGRVNMTPPLAAQPYRYFHDQHEYFCVLLALTQGYCNVRNIMFATEDDERIEDAYFAYDIFPPDRHQRRFGEVEWHMGGGNRRLVDQPGSRNFKNEYGTWTPRNFINTTDRVTWTVPGQYRVPGSAQVTFTFIICQRGDNTRRRRTEFNYNVNGSETTTLLATRIVQKFQQQPDWRQFYDVTDNGDGTVTLRVTNNQWRVWSFSTTVTVKVWDQYQFDRPRLDAFPEFVWTSEQVDAIQLANRGEDNNEGDELSEEVMEIVGSNKIRLLQWRRGNQGTGEHGARIQIQNTRSNNHDLKIVKRVFEPGGDLLLTCIHSDENRDDPNNPIFVNEPQVDIRGRIDIRTEKRTHRAMALIIPRQQFENITRGNVNRTRGWVVCRAEDGDAAYDIEGRIEKAIYGDTHVSLILATVPAKTRPSRREKRCIFRIRGIPLTLNRLDAKGAREVGPFLCQGPDMQISHVDLDVVFPRGLWRVKPSTGDIYLHSVLLVFRFTEVDENDRPTGLRFAYFPKAIVPELKNWAVGNKSGNAGFEDPYMIQKPMSWDDIRAPFKAPQIVAATKTPVRLTFRLDIDEKIRQRKPFYKGVRVKRSNTYRFQVTAQNYKPSDNWLRDRDSSATEGFTEWAGLRGISRGRNKKGQPYAELYGGTTLMAIRVRATDGLSQAARSRVRALVERTIPTMNARIAGRPNDRVVTDNPIDIYADILCDKEYGAGLPPSDLDGGPGGSLTNARTRFHNHKVKFNGIFEQDGTVVDALKQVCQLAAAAPIPLSNSFGILENRKRTANQVIFTDFHIVRDSFEMSWQFEELNEPDGFEIEYYDPETFVPKFVTVTPDAKRPERFNLLGCTDEDYARKYGQFLWHRKRWLRTSIEFEAELDGMIPSVGDRIGVQTSRFAWAKSIRVVEYQKHTGSNPEFAYFWLEGDYELKASEKNQHVYLRDVNGYMVGPVSAYQVRAGKATSPSGQNSIRYRTEVFIRDKGAQNWALNSSPDHTPHREPMVMIHGPPGAVRSFVVTRIAPSNDGTVRISAVNYDERIFKLDHQK